MSEYDANPKGYDEVVAVKERLQARAGRLENELQRVRLREDRLERATRLLRIVLRALKVKNISHEERVRMIDEALFHTDEALADVLRRAPVVLVPEDMPMPHMPFKRS